jgi:hypothetical protein
MSSCYVRLLGFLIRLADLPRPSVMASKVTNFYPRQVQKEHEPHLLAKRACCLLRAKIAASRPFIKLAELVPVHH